MGKSALIYPNTVAFDVVKADPSDNRLLEAAFISKAQYLVTGDKQLLLLKRFGQTHILRAPELLKILG